MSTINPGDFPIDPYSVDGVELANRLNRLKAALFSGLSSATRPPDVVVGGMWTRTTSTGVDLMLHGVGGDAVVASTDGVNLFLPPNAVTKGRGRFFGLDVQDAGQIASYAQIMSGTTGHKTILVSDGSNSRIVSATATGNWKPFISISFAGENATNIDIGVDNIPIVLNGPTFISSPGSSIWGIKSVGGNLVFEWSGVDTYRMQSTGFEPMQDNAKVLGSASLRWNTVFAGTGSINTSDARLKEQVTDVDVSERRVAASLKGLIRKFKYKDTVAKKGSDARWHFGVIAQDVKAAFEAEGLDGFRYGVLCYDEWEAQPASEAVVNDEGTVIHPATEASPAGDRYGVRYDELFAFIISAM